MNLRYFKVFAKVYEQLNMSTAAEELFISQPAVSRIIHEMEDYYSVRFFLRQSGKLIRTPAGERFYHYAKDLLACEEMLSQAMADQRKNRKVTMGVSPALAGRFLPRLLSGYRQECGELNVRVFSSKLETLEQMLLDSRLELAIVEGQTASWELTVLPLFQEPLILVAAPDFQLPPAGQPLPMLVRDAGEMERHRFELAFRTAGVEYGIQGTFVDAVALKRCALAGLGLALVPQSYLSEEDGLNVLEIPGIQLETKYAIIYHRQRFLFPELSHLIDYIVGQLSRDSAGG